ncbi:hypothetical protein BDW22DRAFT_1045439 [Trametopsis cervina]|nr:hypothetical protein BDW22DRAFT_1045439 [Trametopsis cervina]
MKFYVSTVDQCCTIMITDTKHVWGEVLSSKHIARRWRECNPGIASPLLLSEEEEDEWRGQTLDLLSTVHSLSGIADLSFEVVESRNADLAFELRSEEFTWRWEAYSLGPKISAEVISKQLIMPLVSVTHMAFASPEAVGTQSEAELEKSVDKVGRTARRTTDTHIRTAISKPRVASSLRRMTAVFNFLPDMPPIIAEAPPYEFKLPVVQPKYKPVYEPESSKLKTRSPSPGPSRKPVSTNDNPCSRSDESSATEKSSGDEVSYSARKGKAAMSSRPNSPVQTGSKEGGASSDSSPVRQAKKSKKFTSSDSDSDDSEGTRKRKIARLKGASRGSGPKQPVKRGGRRF